MANTPHPLLLAASVLGAASVNAQTLFPLDVELTESPAADSLAVGDLNGDGINDFLLTSNADARTKVALGEGSDTYGTPIDLGIFNEALPRMQVIDLDQDGRQDILLSDIVNNGQSTYRWGRQTGDLTFEFSEVLSFPSSVWEPTLTDLGGSGAGNFALVVARQGTGAEIYRWNGATFNASPIMIPISGVRNLRLLDVNDDGRDDIAAYNQLAQRWQYASYLGGDQFSTPRSFTPIQVLRSPAIRMGDLDGDGDSDLVALADNDDTKIYLFERTAPGIFGPPIERFASARINDGTFFDLADLDGDGLMDILALVATGTSGNTTSFGPTWMRSLGAFDLAPEQDLGGFPFADVDGDGRPEGRTGPFRAQYLIGGGVSPDPWYSTTVTIGQLIRRFATSFAFDTDGDGDPDIVANDNSDDQFEFEHLGGLNFEGPRALGPIERRENVIAEADFVGDAELDLLTGGSELRLRIERGIAPGVYAPPVVISSPLNGTPYVADIDGDGDLDVIQSDDFPTGAHVYFIENSGIGNQFPRRITISFQEGTSSAMPVDVDGDGTPELLTRETSVPGVAVRQNLGGGDFGPPAPLDSSLPLGFSVRRAIDLDSDGDIDLLGVMGSGAFWSENLGQSNFAAPEEVSLGDWSPEIRDLDGNGLLDVILLQQARYRLQTSPGILGDLGTIAPRLPSPQVRGLADFDGDGDLDAWVTTLSNALYIVENFATPPAGGAAEVCATGNLNSTGRGGELRAYGSDAATSTDLRLSAVQLPPNQFGFFVSSQEVGTPFPVAGTGGSVCLRGSIGRYIGPGEVQSSGASGSFSIDLDPTALLTGNGPMPAIANETWFFQGWHRDVDSGGAPTSQFTNALGILFTP